jgi:hypothetical protein
MPLHGNSTVIKIRIRGVREVHIAYMFLANLRDI